MTVCATRRSRHPAAALAAAAGLGLVGTMLASAPASTTPASAEPSDTRCADRTNNTYRKLLQCVTLDDVREHQEQFQKIADNNDDPHYPGTRAAGTQGYADSVTYVAELLEDAGYEVTLDEFEFDFIFPAVLEQLAPVEGDYETGAFTGSGAGDVTGDVIPVDLALEPPRDSTSGCEASDFDGLDFSGPSDIALIQRGACTFATKALHAEAAGAEAVVIFNQGNDPTREGLIVGTLGDADVGIPVVGASFGNGVELAQPGSTARVHVVEPETRTDVNVIAELPGRNPDNVVMAGAHLDSVTDGPGINDNTSGSAAILETALEMAKIRPHNTLRFAWWGAEERGLIGSTAYIDELPQEELDRIAMYLNYDMVGSPNHVQMTYDADQSTFEAPVPVPEGSEAIEDLYESYYTWIDEPYDDAEFSGRSDYQAFIENGIPSGGLFTGAEVVKTPEQEAIWGGTAGEQFDQCYHEACDTFGNVHPHALEVNSDLIAFAQLTFAYSTESVNGVPGRQVPGLPRELPDPAGPEGTFGSTDGGAELDRGGADM
ncbi:M20/M25/M40 family metallo-hydrolase [Actinobacteria bacterium YIM 96077]|uniref:Aminopeptidase n=1 Tax=Phytoactinopolyspora halophila TaxID=1981511 RepID=A0A329QZ87_9ACTN|nr:M20/M25/M40 family metallo-hydrolase [Phytoactinopolyspora halophila]AYY15435.1 M20/M25/M40 family metallo-hydrolase [Actinobacteria bacterium YIM 96077]RAW17710.1 aminopeptidase [Phytoactinopolyspora halophila]